MKSKSEAHYQTTPRGEQRCELCSMFRDPNRCTLVRGHIAAAGWCKYFKRKK